MLKINEQEHCSRFFDMLNQGKNSYMSNKLVTFNKYRNKKYTWKTQRLLASIRHTYKLYKQINKS